MEEIRNSLKARTNYLSQLKAEKESALQTASEGSLRICCHEDKAQYYQRNAPKDFNGVYIRSGEVGLAFVIVICNNKPK